MQNLQNYADKKSDLSFSNDKHWKQYYTISNINDNTNDDTNILRGLNIHYPDTTMGVIIIIMIIKVLIRGSVNINDIYDNDIIDNDIIDNDNDIENDEFLTIITL